MWTGNDQIFKTYVRGRKRGDGKAPAEKVKGRDSISTFDEASQNESFGGILQEGTIDISFDDPEMYKTFLEMAKANSWRCLALPSTHGGHTYWRNSRRMIKNGADKRLAVGFVADIHSGSTYIPLRVHGADRFPPDYDATEDGPQEVPEELLPMDTQLRLWRMKTGEGRNADLFRYIQTLQAAWNMPQDVIIRVLANTNRFVFSDPLPDNEFETITRDEAFERPSFYKGSTFLHDRFGDYIADNEHVVSIGGQLHVYRNGVYVPGYANVEKAMIEEIRGIRDSQRREVIRYLTLTAPVKKAADARYVGFKNGILDIKDDRLMPFDPELVVINQIPWDYVPGSYDRTADRMLQDVACGDDDIRALLEECIGYCMFRRNELRKAFILTGGKRGGKSTYLDCIKALLGDENVSSLDLKEIGDRFSTAMLYGKLANIGDDIDDDFLVGGQVAMFKKVVAGNRIKAERKGYDPFDFDPYAKLLFSANEIPRMRDRGNAVLDRLIIIPFNAVFDKNVKDYDPFLKYKLIQKEPMQYMLLLGVAALKRILTDGFTESSLVKQRMDEYERENNPLLAFLQDMDMGVEILGEPTSDVYRKYSVFCDENGFKPVGKTVFSRQVCKVIGACTEPVKINGKSTRIYRKGE